MSESVRKFLELLETDPVLKREAEERSGKGDDGIAELIALAAANGIILTLDDFRPPESAELSEDELEAVTGGVAVMECICPLWGTGGQCSCSASGQGTSGLFCSCTVGGYGSF